MAEGITAQEPQPLKEVYGYFAGPIDQQAVQRITNAITIASNSGIGHIHMLFQTNGGIVGDGICIFNIFKTSPVPVTLYNAGSIASVGVIAYLGASRRKTTHNATFMMHKTYFSPVGATFEKLQSAANTAVLDDQRTESILHTHLRLPQEKWDTHKFADMWLSSDEAISSGLADCIGEFAPPKGFPLFYVGQI